MFIIISIIVVLSIASIILYSSFHEKNDLKTDKRNKDYILNS